MQHIGENEPWKKKHDTKVFPLYYAKAEKTSL